MPVRTLLLALLASMLAARGPHAHASQPPQRRLRLALLSPRTPQLATHLKRRNRELLQRTGGQVSLQVFWGGSAGDERTVLRKMRGGQVDAAALTLQAVSEFVREALVLESPALCLNYAQLDAVRGALAPRFEQEALRNGFKILLWGDFGRLRYFSTRALRTPRDFRRARPWKLPGSPLMGELYKVLGTTGVPLELAEVYGAVETGMIDTYWATALIAALLQWHRTTRYVSEPMGFINGALVVSRRAWQKLPPEVAGAVEAMAQEEGRKLQKRFRAQDEHALTNLLRRGYRQLPQEAEEEWWGVGKALRQRLVGRAFTRRLLDEAERIAIRHADPAHRRRLSGLR